MVSCYVESIQNGGKKKKTRGRGVREARRGQQTTDRHHWNCQKNSVQHLGVTHAHTRTHYLRKKKAHCIKDKQAHITKD